MEPLPAPEARPLALPAPPPAQPNAVRAVARLSARKVGHTLEVFIRVSSMKDIVQGRSVAILMP